MIGALYVIEAQIRDQGLAGEAKRTMRLTEAKPVVDRFFAWVNKLFEDPGFLPSSPLTTALAYARERREALEVYLGDPDVQIDTNHLERALRAIPMSRKNWLFSWTELGAMHVGIVHKSLGDLPAARHRPLRLLRRCAAAGRPASGFESRAVDATAMEGSVRRQSASFRPIRSQPRTQSRRWLTAYS